MEFQNDFRIKPGVGATVDWGCSISKGLIGCWLFNEKSGTWFKDIAGNNYGRGSPDLKFTGKGIVFPNLASSITLPLNFMNFERTDKFTFFAVVNDIYNFTNTQTLFSRQQASNNTGIAIEIHNSSRAFRFAIFNDDSPSNFIEVRSSQLQSGKRYSLMATYNGSSGARGVNLYVNGVKDNATISADTLTQSIRTNTTPKIGNYAPTGTFPLKAYLDMAAVWRRELKQEEAQDMYINPYWFLYPNSIPIMTGEVASSALTFRKTLSPVGSRTGSRQTHGWN